MQLVLDVHLWVHASAHRLPRARVRCLWVRSCVVRLIECFVKEQRFEYANKLTTLARTCTIILHLIQTKNDLRFPQHATRMLAPRPVMTLHNCDQTAHSRKLTSKCTARLRTQISCTNRLERLCNALAAHRSIAVAVSFLKP